MLSNPIELAAVVKDVVLLSLRNILVFFKERNEIEKLVGVIVLVFSKESLLQGNVIFVNPLF
jgi:hypothetical protein